MDNDNSKLSPLCTAGCGFYGSEMYNNMCSKCYKSSQMTNKTDNDKKSLDPSTSSSTTNNNKNTTTDISNTTLNMSTEKISINTSSPASNNTTTTTTTTTTTPTGITATSSPQRSSRKHSRSPSPVVDKRPMPSPLPVSTSEDHQQQQPTPQHNKNRCYQCRAKVPLVKQTTNKCRCQYIFCDSHRYPDRHDCVIDYAQLDRVELAKKNPKLHDRPAGGRSFRRIDSL